MRIYEVKPGYHVDLKSIVGIQKYQDEAPCKERNPKFRYWLEIVFNHGEFYEVSCKDAADLDDKYEGLLKAWKAFVDDKDVINNISSGRRRVQEVYKSIEDID
ncbi:MAG: hypothetical protein Q4A36_01130 [Candidatus Saccharibacteria bacterium]|nr:hypothetical protein [Candidatus Saccharibacteria bacterium]